MTRARVALVVAAVLLLPVLGAAQDAAPSFTYFHVEANEGGASGGHVAIGFGEQVFHFQFHDGILRLHRDDASAFVHTYARLQNRTIHEQRVAVSADTYATLRRRFSDRFVLETQQFATLDALRAERDVLAELLDADSDAQPRLPVRGGGFFAAVTPGGTNVTAGASASPQGQAIAARRSDVAAELLSLTPESAPAVTPAGPHSFAAPPPSYAERAGELLEAQAALDVLQGDAALRADAVRSATLDDLILTPDEVAALRAFATALDAQVAALLASSRPDWGSAMLLVLARRAAVERSLAGGRLVVLDAYPDGAAVLSPAEVAAHAEALPSLLADARADLARARRPLAASAGIREADYTALEGAANRFLELHAAITAGSALRVASGPLLPSRRELRPLPLPALGREELRARLDDATARAERYAAELRTRYAYELLTRNCVSEVFHEIAEALAGEEPPSGGLDCAGSRARLGGCVDPEARLRFIPFVSADAVAAEYPLTATRELPSYRAAALADMYAHENDLAVFLRESNVLTSTIYRRHDEDSPFLFFTDDALLARPLFGVLNLATGLGASAAGLFLLPTGDDRLLVDGLRGALFSVPELAFVSLRKGSFAYVPRESAAPETMPPGTSTAAARS